MRHKYKILNMEFELTEFEKNLYFYLLIFVLIGIIFNIILSPIHLIK